MTRVWPLWRRDGVIERGPYLTVGLAGFAVKHQIDRWVAHLFHRGWGLTSYWAPLRRRDWAAAMFQDDAEFFLSLLLVALPFIWVGVCLTLRRLRAAALPLPLVAFFFVPYLNLLLFALLCLVRSRPESKSGGPAAENPAFGPPIGRLASALLALLVSVTFGLLFSLLSALALGIYSWSLFAGMPFFMGLIVVLVYGRRQPRRFRENALLAFVAPVLLGVGLLAFDIEGAVCLIMAAPLGGALSIMGGAIGHVILQRRWSRARVHAVLLLAVILGPLLLGADRAVRPAPPLLLVTSRIDIDAPPATVWRRVVAFSEIPEPRDWLFRSGIAYPVRAAIEGRGAGAVRHCVFSTGEFLEPIEVWDEPHLLRFSVRSSPPPMVEWTPYRSIHAPHLEGYFVARRGQFLLEPLGGGRTRVVASTWYQHAIWPTVYWRLWSDAIVHRIHVRVLEQIRSLAEGDAGDAAG